MGPVRIAAIALSFVILLVASPQGVAFAQEDDPLSLKHTNPGWDPEESEVILAKNFTGVWEADTVDREGKKWKATLRVRTIGSNTFLELHESVDDPDDKPVVVKTYGAFEIEALKSKAGTIPSRYSVTARLRRIQIEPLPILSPEVGRIPLQLKAKTLAVEIPYVPVDVQLPRDIPVVWRAKPTVVRLRLIVKNDKDRLSGTWAVESEGNIVTQGDAYFSRLAK